METVTAVPTPQPCLLVVCKNGDVKNCYIVIEKNVLCSVNIDIAIILLFACFFAFNMEYTSGCTNLFTFLKHLFLETKIPNRRTQISSFISELVRHS